MKKGGIIKQKIKVAFFVGLMGILFMQRNIHATEPKKMNAPIAASKTITLTIGKSMILQNPEPVKRVSLADPLIADVMILTPKQVYLTGKTPGLTNLTLWSSSERVSTIFDIEVMPNTAQLKEKLHEMFPEEEDIRVTTTHDRLTLSGTITSTTRLSEVMAIAASFAPTDKDNKPMINNLLQVGGVHQVMLEIRVSEMSRSIIKKLGINFNAIGSTGTQFGVSVLDNLSSVSSLAIPLQQSQGNLLPFESIGISPGVNAIFRFLDNDTPWTFLIDALKDQGLIKILAEPTLITLSGKTANFLAGGEFPIPVPQPGASGVVVTIDYKPFGVGLQFTPTVLSNGKISMEVAPEVSELDFSQGVSFGGFIIPALSTRRVSTVIELGDGQSFAIAGLLRENVREYVRKFPLLGDIPILGSLFRSLSFQKNETELVIIATPHLVKPLDQNKQSLPSDEFLEPDDFEFFLGGHLEERATYTFKDLPADIPRITPSILDTGGGLEGDFGHIQP